MLRYLTKFLLLISILSILFTSCSIRKGLMKNEAGCDIPELIKPIISQPYGTIFYKASFYVRNINLTGIFIFKDVDTSQRIVFISEVGLKYFDLEYSNDTWTVVDCKKFLENEWLIGQVENSLKLIIDEVLVAKRAKLYKKKESNEKGLLFKRKNSKYCFLWNNKNKITEIRLKEGIFNHLIMKVNSYKENLPRKILINNRSIINFKIELKLLKTNDDVIR